MLILTLSGAVLLDFHLDIIHFFTDLPLEALNLHGSGRKENACIVLHIPSSIVFIQRL